MGKSSGAYELSHECASVLSLIKFTREVKIISIVYSINKTLLGPFCVYRRQSPGRFRILLESHFFKHKLINLIHSWNVNAKLTCISCND